jgi:MFS family permease
MATRAETRVVYAAGAAQGIVLVTFPAASTIFTSPSGYGLSNTQYGDLFLPQVATAIAASLVGAWLSRRVGTKRVFVCGLGAGLVSMLLLIASTFVESDTSAAFPLLLVATAFLGVGFGLSVPALNTLTAAFHPDGVDSAVLVLNALLGLGTALAPVLVAIFVGLGSWWGLPVVSALLLTVLLAASVRLPLRVAAAAPAGAGGRRSTIPPRFWVYAAFAVLYGICETVNGNWSQLEATRELGASTTIASLSLTAFWAAVTGGRLAVAAIGRWISVRVTYHVLPLVLAGAFLIVSALGSGDGVAGVVAFALAGLGCSALLPLTISFGEGELVAISAAVAGGVIAFYQLGYGIAAFGVGPLLDNGVTLSSIFAFSAIIAAALALVSFAVTRTQPARAPQASFASRPES